MIQGRFKSIKKKFKGFLREFNGRFNDILRKFQGCLMGVKCLPKKFQIKFQEFSRMFQWSFFLQFCCCMDFIAATRAEGGLVNKDGKMGNGADILI